MNISSRSLFVAVSALGALIACDAGAGTQATPDSSGADTAEDLGEDTTAGTEDTGSADAAEDVADTTPSDAAADTADTSPRGPMLAIRVIPLFGSDLVDACYDLRVATGAEVLFAAGDPAFATENGQDDTDDDDTAAAAKARGTLCASDFGGGASGELDYLTACRSGEDHDVTVWVHNLYGEERDLGDDTWRSPCGSTSDAAGAAPETWDGGCTLRTSCTSGSDTAMVFDLTILRESSTGFFDYAVAYGGLFCSAKLTTCYDANAEGTAGGTPVELLFGDNGSRLPTVVVAFACAGDKDAGTTLFASDLTVTCEQDGSADAGWQPQPRSFELAAGAGSGQMAEVPDEGMLASWAIYPGSEDLGDVMKRYWNVAFALLTDGPSSVAGGLSGLRNCKLTGRFAAGADATDFADTDEGFAPVGGALAIDLSVRLTDDAGARDCRDVPLGSDDPDGSDYDVVDRYAEPSMRFCNRLGPGDEPEISAGCQD